MERREEIQNRPEALIEARSKLYDEIQVIEDGIRSFNKVFEPDPERSFREFRDPDSPSSRFADTRVRMGEAAGERIRNLIRQHIFEFYPEECQVRQNDYIISGPIVLSMQEAELFYQPLGKPRSDIPIEGVEWYWDKDSILARVLSLPIS